MRLHQLNIPAVALLVIQLSDSQYRLLEQLKDIVLMLDGDDAGTKATRRIETELKSRGKDNIQSICLPVGRDPDDLTNDELWAVVSLFFLTSLFLIVPFRNRYRGALRTERFGGWPSTFHDKEFATWRVVGRAT